MAQDIIIGVSDRYNWDQIKYWANSIKKSGFTGHKALVVYNMDAETVKKLTPPNEDFMLIGCNQYDPETGFSHDNSLGSVMVDRFFHIYSFLNMLQEKINRVIITDVRDVIFQHNPTEWLNDNLLTGDLLVGAENMTYANEPWGANNMKQSFGEYFYDLNKDNPIYCAGVIAGTRETIKDLCLNIWLICRGLNPKVPGGGGPDQAALNILLQTNAYKNLTRFTNPTDGWVVHAGTSLPAIEAGSGGIGEAYKQNPNMLLTFISNVVYNVENDFIQSNKNKLTIVHQWDRVPQWKKLVEEKYGD